MNLTECGNCYCRKFDGCWSMCPCDGPGLHLCFDEERNFLGCYRHASSYAELLKLASKVSGIKIKCQRISVYGTTSSGDRFAGWGLFNLEGATSGSVHSKKIFLSAKGGIHIIEQGDLRGGHEYVDAKIRHLTEDDLSALSSQDHPSIAREISASLEKLIST